MYILTENGDTIVNTAQCDTIDVQKWLANGKWFLYAYRGSEQTALGLYETEDAATAALRQVFIALGCTEDTFDMTEIRGGQSHEQAENATAENRDPVQ